MTILSRFFFVAAFVTDFAHSYFCARLANCPFEWEERADFWHRNTPLFEGGRPALLSARNGICFDVSAIMAGAINDSCSLLNVILEFSQTSTTRQVVA